MQVRNINTFSHNRDHRHASICCKHWHEVTWEHINIIEKYNLTVTG